MPPSSAEPAIHELWDELADRGLGGTTAALDRLLVRIAGLLGASRAYWMGAVRMDELAVGDPLQGWRPQAVHFFTQDPAKAQANYRGHYQRIKQRAVDPSVVANLEGVGRFRIHILHEMVDEAWYESEFYHTFFAPMQIRDAIFVTMPLSPDAESWLCFQRTHDKPLFGEDERRILDHTNRPLKWFHRQVALSHGVLLAEQCLTPSERRVIHDLLGPKTEAKIAKELNLAPSTVHTYLTRICRKFNVRGRVGLTALWLGKEIPEDVAATQDQSRFS